MEKEKCTYCIKEIEAYSKQQLNMLMIQHKLAKHPDKVKIEVKK